LGSCKSITSKNYSRKDAKSAYPERDRKIKIKIKAITLNIGNVHGKEIDRAAFSYW